MRNGKMETNNGDILIPIKETKNVVVRKKRGRKPKSEHGFQSTVATIEVPIEESRKGRKHVKINYLEVESSLVERNPFKKKKMSPSDNVKVQLVNNEKPILSKDDIIIQNSEALSNETKINAFSKKYNYTGETSKMIEQIFSSALKRSNSNNTDGNLTIRQSDHLIKNEENKITCAVCSNKIDSEEWTSHNENNHYNLGWQEGETALALDNYSIVNKKLKPLFNQHKKIACLKCKKAFTKPKEFILHKEECEGISSNGKVTCAVCNESILRDSWSRHKLKHNNLAWRTGDHPLDLKNKTLVLQVLQALYKAKKPLQCETCNAVKKSVVGFLSHRAQCETSVEEAKIACELCGKKCLPVSMPTHIKMVHTSTKKQEIKRSGYFDVDVSTHHGKRKAATKALDKIDEFTKGDKVQYFRHYVKELNFEEDNTFMLFLKKELEENKLIKCKIKGCEFAIEDIWKLLKHMKICPLKPNEYYTCKRCFLNFSNENEVTEHLKFAHDLKFKEDDDYEQNDQRISDEDEGDQELMIFDNIGRKTISMEKKKQLIKFQKDEDPSKAKPLFILETSRKNSIKFSLFSHAFEYMLKFCNLHFISNNLEHLKCNEHGWNLIEEDPLETYLPSLEESCDVSIKIVNGFGNIYGSEHTFKRFEMFEVQLEENFITIFCGGPVTSMAWLPTPHTSFDKLQILAVAVGQNFDAKYNVEEFYFERTLIQFWNFRKLKNYIQPTEPRLEFGLAFDYGPIWHLEWCPSGCFNVEDSEEWSRMGLLAVAGSHLPVHIYSIPLLNENKTGLFYKAKPVLKLQLIREETNLKRKLFPTKISWSKISGSKCIAVGYTDGNIAVYNLDTTSNLLFFKDKTSVDVLLPFKVIKAHVHFVSALSWVPVDCDRWLFSASFDKNIFVWDLYNEDKFATRKSKILVDGAWLTHWLSHLTTLEESTPTNGCLSSTQIYHREYLFENFNLSVSSATITTISGSDWLNGFVQSNTVGEINSFFPHQMLYDPQLIKKGLPFQFLMGYTKLIDKTKSPEERLKTEKKKHDILKPIPRKFASYTIADFVKGKEFYDMFEPLDYQEATNQYGVVFCDIKPDKPFPLKKMQKESDYSKPHLYPLQEVTKICFNPNRQASLYYASGYQIGFVRLTYLKHLEKDGQVLKSEKYKL